MILGEFAGVGAPLKSRRAASTGNRASGLGRGVNLPAPVLLLTPRSGLEAAGSRVRLNAPERGSEEK